ncbi:hypothetical protein ACFLRN_10665, partial [Thermoproteota archaeon]
MEFLGKKTNQANHLLSSLRKYGNAIAQLDGLRKQFGMYEESIKQSNEQIGKLIQQIKEDQDFVNEAKEKHEQLKELEDFIKNLEKQDQRKESIIIS